MTRWLNNGQDGMTEERLGYIEGWFHKEDKEAFELAIEVLHFMNNHKVVLFAENMTEKEKQKLVAEFKSVMDNAKFTVCSERPQGKWIEVGDNQPYSKDKLYGCSECGFGSYLLSDTECVNFCPMCGAQMIKEVKKNDK